MSNYIQFRIARQTVKADGKEYKRGDLFPFEAGNEAHRRMWQQGIIVEENVNETPKRAVKK
jgi:hypothetical protein